MANIRPRTHHFTLSASTWGHGGLCDITVFKPTVMLAAQAYSDSAAASYECSVRFVMLKRREGLIRARSERQS